MKKRPKDMLYLWDHGISKSPIKSMAEVLDEFDEVYAHFLLMCICEEGKLDNSDVIAMNHARRMIEDHVKKQK